MTYSVQMPALGESVTEGTVTRWLKNEGDSIKVDEPLLEVSTDKVDTEIPSPVAGILQKIVVAVDQTVAVGAELAVIATDGAAAAPVVAAPVAAAPTPPPPPPVAHVAPVVAAPVVVAPVAVAPAAAAPVSAGAGTVITMPALGESVSEGTVTRWLKSVGESVAVDEALLEVSTDKVDTEIPSPVAGVLTAIDVPVDTTVAVGARLGFFSSSSSAPVAATTSAPRPAAVAASPLRGTTVQMSRLRKVIAARMVESLQVSAQLTTVIEVDVTKISRLRNRAKATFEGREGVKLTFLPFFAVAVCEALKQHPVLNSSVDGDQITYHSAEHLGIAVDTERGLLVPVIHNAGDLNMGGVARKIADLAARTRDNKVTPDELGGGTFTLTNTGSRGALFDTPIINQPQVAILGLGAVVKRPMVVKGEDGGETIAIRDMVYLGLSYDHRVVDGADAARFLVTLKERLEAGNFEADLGL